MGSIISRRRANAQEPRPDEVLVAEPHDQSVRSVSVTGAGHSLPDENAPEPGHEDASVYKRVAAAGMRDRAAQRREREAQRQAELKADAATPTRIRQTLQEFLEKDFQSEQDLRAADLGQLEWRPLKQPKCCRGNSTLRGAWRRTHFSHRPLLLRNSEVRTS